MHVCVHLATQDVLHIRTYVCTYVCTHSWTVYTNACVKRPFAMLASSLTFELLIITYTAHSCQKQTQIFQIQNHVCTYVLMYIHACILMLRTHICTYIQHCSHTARPNHCQTQCHPSADASLCTQTPSNPAPLQLTLRWEPVQSD